MPYPKDHSTDKAEASAKKVKPKPPKVVVIRPVCNGCGFEFNPWVGCGHHSRTWCGMCT